MSACINIVRPSVLLVALFLWLSTIANGKDSPVELFSPSFRQMPTAITKDLQKGLRVILDQTKARSIWENEPESFEAKIPLPGGSEKLLTFNKRQIVSPDFSILTSDGKTLTGKEFSGVHYQVDSKLGEEKVGTLSFSKTGLISVISDKTGNLNIGPLPNGEGDYVIYNDHDLNVKSPFKCETPDQELGEHEEKGNGEDKSIETSGNCRTLKLYFECDYKMYQDNGSSTTNVSNVVAGFFNCVAQIYMNESVAVEISQIYVWTTPDAYPSSASTNLTAFRTLRTTFNGNLAHLLSTKPLAMGGVAYLNILCSPYFSYGFSNIYNTYSLLPNYSWTVHCVTHELGHNMGSNHTHWCGWQLTSTTNGPIDRCYTPEPFNGVGCGTTTTAQVGTVMSYCHLNGSVNLALGFGTLPGNKIRTGFNAATCISGSALPAFSVSAPSAVCSGDNISLKASSVSAATYAWTGPNGFTSTLQNPTVSNASSSAQGSYACTVSKSGCTTDPNPVSVIVNTPTVAPVSESFAGTFPSSGWRNINTNGDRTWGKFTGAGGFGTSTTCVRIDNFSYPAPTGTKDTLMLPVVNLSGMVGSSLKFDVAYCYNGSYNDSLFVVVSSNCGKTFTRVYAKGKNTLATVPNSLNPFTPTSTQWRLETLDLSAFDGGSTVQVAFVNKCGGSNYLYLDNINLTASAGTGTPAVTLGTLAQSSYCPGATVSVPFSNSGTFNSGNTFTVQLSNASGSFASPTSIGSGTSSPIAATIPAGTASGSGYMIRVVSGNPVVNSGNSTAISISPLTVSAGVSHTACSNGSAITLTGTPAGGTWSGSGVTTAGIFTPSVGLIGTQTLTYSVSQSGCSGSNQTTVTVNALPTVTAGSNLTTCASSAAFSLTGFSPTGGTWTGNGVTTAGVFTPSVALIGIQTLTYTATQNGCTSTGIRTVTVSASVTVNAGTNQTLCANGSAVTLTGSPSGGTWSGSGVTTTGVFTPSTALVGAQNLTYTVTGTCGGTDQTTVTVNAAPNANAGIDRTFCSTDASFLISQGSPVGGTWSGSSAVDASGNFTIGAATTGTHNLVYSITQSGCTDTDIAVFTINNSPSASVGANQTACAGSGSVTLTGAPAGGSWAGNGVTSGGTFTPSGSNLGANNLTYTVVQNGCSASASLQFTVNSTPTASAGTDQSATTASSDITLSGTPAGGTWSGTGVLAGVFSPSTSGAGSFTLTYSVTQSGCTDTDQMVMTVTSAASVSAGADVLVCEAGSSITLTGSPSGGFWTGNGVSSGGVFTPNTSLIGNQVLTYTVSGVGADEVTVQVVNSPDVTVGANQNICSSASNFTVSGASPAGGTWSGTGVTAAGLVTVSQLSTSGSTFTYTVSVGGCSSSGTVVYTKVNPPSVNAGTNQNLCSNAAPMQLNGNPVGGTWSGPGVGADGIFNAAAASIGSNTLTYTVQGALAGCAGTDQLVVSVFAIPSVNAGIDRSTCDNASAFSLSGTPSGGSWSGPGVSLAGLYSPNSSLVGVQTLTYSVTQNGCTGSATMELTVNALPVVSAGGSQSICNNSSNFNISGATPSGGTWSGASFVNASGLCSGPFPLGSFTLNYTVTQNGCTASDQAQFTVSPSPSVNAGNNRFICTNGASLQLTGFSPAGGIWSGNGVSPTGVFSPTTSLAGNQTLTYTVSQNGCTSSDAILMTVRSAPVIATGPDHTACESGISFKVSGYTPPGGKWTGPGITQDSIFNPSSSLVGPQTITYTAIKNGCSNTAQKVVTVTPGNTFTVGTYPNSICSNGSATSFTGFLPAGGTWKGAGMAPNGVLTPSASILGNHTYTYKLTLNGCRDSVQVQSTIQAIPLVSAGADISVCATGSAVGLINATPTGGTWSGQGVTDSGIFDPSLVSVGAQSLTYSVTQNGCTGSDVLVANVQSSPAVNAGVDRNICKNSIPVTLTGSPFGGTWSGTGVSPTGVFTPNASMSGNITLSYSINQSGCTGSDQVIISITNAVTASAGTNQSVCSNAQAFTLAGFSPAGGSWAGNGVSPTGLFTPDSSLVGTQTLVYTVTKNNCTVQASKTVSVNTSPVVVAGNDQTLCNNALATQLSGYSPVGGSWTGAGVNASGLFTPTSAMSGLQVLTYSFTQNGCTSTDSKVLTITPAPVVEAGSDQLGCGLGTLAMTEFFPTGGTWTGNGISASGVFTPQAGNLGNTVSVSYSVTQNGCTSSDTKQLTIINIPTQVTVSSSQGLAACAGQTVPLALNISNPSAFNIQWQRNNVDVAGAIDSLLFAAQSGTYMAILKVASCSVNSESKVVVINPVPGAPTITVSGNTFTSSAASGNQWKRNGQEIAGATQPQYTATQSGIYTVVAGNGNCLSEPSAALSFTFTEVDEVVAEAFDFKLYPNPNEGRFQVEVLGLKAPEAHLAIVSTTGQTVWQQKAQSDGDLKIRMDVEMPILPAGVYWMQLRSAERTILKKFILR